MSEVNATTSARVHALSARSTTFAARPDTEPMMSTSSARTWHPAAFVTAKRKSVSPMGAARRRVGRDRIVHGEVYLQGVIAEAAGPVDQLLVQQVAGVMDVQGAPVAGVPRSGPTGVQLPSSLSSWAHDVHVALTEHAHLAAPRPRGSQVAV